MHSSLRILQITLIITQITTVKGSSYTTSTTSASASASALPNSNVTAGPSAMQTVSLMTSFHVTSGKGQTNTAAPISNVTALSSETTKTGSIVDSSSPTQTGLPMTKVPVTSTTQQLTTATKVFNSSNVTIGVSSSTTPRIWTSTSLNGSVSKNATKTGSQTITVPNTTAIELSTKTNNAVPVASTKATTLSPFGLLTGQTQSITTGYLLSSASRPGSNSAASKQTPTTSLSVSVNWTDWCVDSSDCKKYCSEKGGTVTASRQCYSHSETLKDNVCTQHGNLTKVVQCGDENHCPISGKEVFGSSISTLAVSILLVMLSSTFVPN